MSRWKNGKSDDFLFPRISRLLSGAEVETVMSREKDENTSADQTTATQKDAVVSTHKVTVNGTPIVCSIYNIDGRNYFKLRDIAMALKGTQKEFSLTWYEDQFAMDLIPGDTYEPDGSGRRRGRHPS